ncbi:SH3 domain-containing protein [Streptosporangium lutulentum]|uniref:SH3 domain-containing protein n=1 Tax=Streptosporangium lutulentum TaxID=1461250 RepID=A0ABT9Q8J9_9ACTN|nr:SH3 domain-containing protein [Streptosporangium lutulentum]MDP9843071.1 hypothetical protein [Streptosporangium lutulentum]
MIAKQTTTPVTACVIASGPILTALPAHATTRPVTLDGRPAPTCAYRLTHARRAGFLNVRSGAGLRFRQIGRLRVADGRLPRARAPIKGWIKVKAADDKHDWASAHYLRKITK